MTEIVLPGSVKKICGGRDREGAFAECKALSKVSSEIEHADIEAGAFFKTPFLDQTEQDFIMSGTLLIACNVKDHVVIPEKTTCICSVIFQKRYSDRI